MKDMAIKNEDLEQTIPFVSGIKHATNEYVGIIINQDHAVTSIYDLANCSDEEKKLILQCGEIWWWESNRKIPINIFMKREMAGFKHMIKSFNTKDVEILFGPVVRLHDIAQKRVKRKSIQLVRKLK
jgi:hypothetical protein